MLTLVLYSASQLGGAMAPAIKELSRWLDANSEYYVAPDWCDVVKHSVGRAVPNSSRLSFSLVLTMPFLPLLQGFLPEAKFSRILTEPVNRDPGSRRRGRRPRSEMPKPLLSVSESASAGLASPLFMNGGLMGSMDSMVTMQNLRSGIPGIPISGIMAAGFPHGFTAAVQAGGVATSADGAKNGLNILPMMLQSIPHPHGAAIPQHAMFSVGAMMPHTPPPHSSSLPTSSSSSSSSLPADKVTTTTSASTPETASPSSTTATESAASSGSDGGEKGRGQEETRAAENRPGGAEAAAIITSTSRAHVGAAIGAGAGSHITFNPFLIPGMSHGLLYPHMFLPHGGIMALPAMPPGAVDGPQSSPRRRRKRVREEGEREEERGEKTVTGSEESESTVDARATSHAAPSSTPSAPSASAPLPEERDAAREEGGDAELQEPDSNHRGTEEPATRESEGGPEEAGRAEAAGDENRDSEERRREGGEEV